LTKPKTRQEVRPRKIGKKKKKKNPTLKKGKKNNKEPCYRTPKKSLVPTKRKSKNAPSGGKTGRAKKHQNDKKPKALSQKNEGQKDPTSKNAQ